MKYVPICCMLMFSLSTYSMEVLREIVFGAQIHDIKKEDISSVTNISLVTKLIAQAYNSASSEPQPMGVEETILLPGDLDMKVRREFTIVSINTKGKLFGLNNFKHEKSLYAYKISSEIKKIVKRTRCFLDGYTLYIPSESDVDEYNLATRLNQEELNTLVKE